MNNKSSHIKWYASASVVIVILITGAVLFGQKQTTVTNIDEPLDTQSITPDEQECINAGRKWVFSDARHDYFCAENYSDAGKKCTDSKDCLGGCIVNNKNATSGFCETSKGGSGCKNMLMNGNVATLCVD